jgi:hypothetical protein
MENVEFEWDDEKADANFKKHGIRFEEGATVFSDPLVWTVFDPDHSEMEDRHISIGISVEGHLLVVIHTERNERIRLISCRKATSSERKIYENE